MGLKLRRAVTCARTTEGIVFRLGDDFLPIEGRRIGDYLQRLLPHFDGKWTAEQLCSTLNEQHRETVSRLVKALQDAGMLYETAADLPVTSSENQSAYVTRVEAQSSVPFRLVSAATHNRLLVLGNVEMAVAAAEAGMEIGLPPPTIISSTWNDHLEERLNIALDGRDNPDYHVTRLDLNSHFDWETVNCRFDTVVIAGDIHRDWEQINTTLSLLPQSIPLLPFLICGARIIAGPVGGTQNTICLRCLAEYYRQRVPPAAAPSPVRAAAGVRMTGKILMQRWMDWKTGMLPADEELLFSELNLQNLEISLCPFLLNFACTHSVRSMHEMARPLDSSSALPPENWQDAFWASAYKFLIHPVTGLIAQVTEGDLIQLPYNQSSAEWYLPDEARKVWTTELAANVRDARVAVIQRALEEFLSLGERTSGTAGLIVSGIEEERFEFEAFFRALALLADQTDTWTAAAIDLQTLKEQAMPLMGYLEDLHVLDLVRVHRHVELSVAGCEILKFTFRGKPVSVVAGPAGPDVWIQGFKDVWMDMTANEDLPRSADILPKIRYRCSEASLALLSLTMHDLRSLLALDFDLALLSGCDIRIMKPLVFASAAVSYKRDHRDGNRYLEGLETADQFARGKR
jgi:hypothetical protein